MIINPEHVSGRIIQMNRTDGKHLAGRLEKNQPKDTSEKGFADALSQALRGVNDLQQESFALNQQMLIDPDSVDSHDLTIAMSKASMAQQITKSVVDNALKAYREIINLR